MGEDRWMENPKNSPIRVMRIIARMNVGGPAVQVTGLMRGIDSVQFDHRLYTGFCSADEADYLDTVASGVDAIRIDGLGRRVNIVADFKALFALVNEIRIFKPHLIHTHTAKAGFLGRVASVLSLHPSIRVHTFHGHLLHGYFSRFKLSLVVFAEKTLFLFTDYLLAVGDNVRRDLLNAGIGNTEKFGLMPPGLLIGALQNKTKSRLSLGLSPEVLHCAYIGRITRIKRPDRFLDVVSEIKRRGLNLEFFIAGDGELFKQCQARIISEELPVTLLGWQSDIEKVLSATDIVVLTSDNEGTPLSLIQAGMAGLPAVATNVGSVSEVVVNGLTGILTGISVSEIADALERLCQSPGLRAVMGADALDFTLANFGVQRLVHDHEELYKKLIANRAKF